MTIALATCRAHRLVARSETPRGPVETFAVKARIDRDLAEESAGAHSLRHRVQADLFDYAAQLTVPAAPAFQRTIHAEIARTA
ncbi:hypothetical protein [Sphingomonas phyllosphaerae]|uniref:hypothetical protein n=1 Tax=Sphingomonas phyllosphaerae TaxID=257003 RepID=UPI0024137D7A|nr:hypothetical protein [Sphingomonas phyllosphaerae]